MSNLIEKSIDGLMDEVVSLVQDLDEEKQVEILNKIKIKLHKVSPFKEEPVDCVIWIKNQDVKANDYNPNKVAPPEMKLLKHSIKMDGYTQPIVVDKISDGFEVIDGFHRSKVGKEDKIIKNRVKGYLPITLIKSTRKDLKDRMSATIRHNRARGVHGITPMIDIVSTLIKQGWNDIDIAKELGMEADEVLRFKQNSGLPELFKDNDFSKSWEVK